MGNSYGCGQNRIINEKNIYCVTIQVTLIMKVGIAEFEVFDSRLPLSFNIYVLKYGFEVTKK